MKRTKAKQLYSAMNQIYHIRTILVHNDSKTVIFIVARALEANMSSEHT